MEYILIFISAIFVNNIVLSQFLGICPFLGVSKKIDTSLGMSAAVAFVLTLATIVTWLVQKYVLDACSTCRPSPSSSSSPRWCRWWRLS